MNFSEKQSDDKPNIIFLDIDGVLNTTVSPDWDNRTFDQNSVKFLKMIMDNCNAKLVISSTWRMGSTYLDFSQLLHIAGLGRMSLFIERQYELGGSPKAWKTPLISTNQRGDEIDLWLKEYGHLINDCIILDDEVHDLHEHQMSRVVQTDHYCGITYREYDKAIGILGQKNTGLTTVSEMRNKCEKL